MSATIALCFVCTVIFDFLYVCIVIFYSLYACPLISLTLVCAVLCCEHFKYKLIAIAQQDLIEQPIWCDHGCLITVHAPNHGYPPPPITRARRITLRCTHSPLQQNRGGGGGHHAKHCMEVLAKTFPNNHVFTCSTMASCGQGLLFTMASCGQGLLFHSLPIRSQAPRA